MDLTSLLQELLFAVVAVSVPIIVKHLTSYLKGLNINTSNEVLNSYITNALEIISDVVISVNQTYVDSLKASGEFSEEAQTEAFEKAKTLAVSLISEEMKLAIETIYGNFESFIEMQIEASVNKEKTV